MAISAILVLFLQEAAASCFGDPDSCPSAVGQGLLQASIASGHTTLAEQVSSEVADSVLQGGDHHVETPSPSPGPESSAKHVPEPVTLGYKADPARQCMDDFVSSVHDEVAKWPVDAASFNGTDRVAATIFTVENPSLLAWKIRWMSRVLGNRWAFQIFYTKPEHKRNLKTLLGHPKHITFTPVRVNGTVVHSMSLDDFNRYYPSHDHWDDIRHEHVLWFEVDTMLIQGSSCFDSFLQYDYNGAPWPENWNGFGFSPGGNGGLSLARKSAMVKAVDSLPPGPWNESDGKLTGADLVFVRKLQSLGAKFPDRETALGFSEELVCDNDHPCGLHKPACWVAPWQSWCTVVNETFQKVRNDQAPENNLIETGQAGIIKPNMTAFLATYLGHSLRRTTAP